MYLARVLLHIPTGLITIGAGTVIGFLVFQLDPRDANWSTYALAAVVATLSLCAVGLLGGSIALITRDVWSSFGVLGGLIFVLGGGVIPVEQLPGLMPELVSIVPMRWGIEAMKEAFAGGSLVKVWWLLGYELGLAALYFGLGFALFRWFEASAKRRRTLEFV